MSDYRFASYSRVTNARAADLEIYGWCLFVEADAATLRQIDAVEYTLHPTFENPVRRITDPANCFMMETTGWGGFRIAIRVFVKGPSSSPLDMSFMLDLSPDGWPLGQRPDRMDTPEEERVFAKLFHRRYEWRTLPTIARGADLSDTDAHSILEKLTSRRLVRRAPYLHSTGQQLWGATHVVGLLPEPTA